MEAAQDVRQQRGLVIAATARITKRDAGTWIVPSQSDKGRYAVTITKEGKFCACPDFELSQQPCKHVYAVQYVLFRETSTNGDESTTVRETASVRVTYAQNWPIYNAAQVSEKETFLNLLRDPCANVPEPEQTRGRPRIPLSDMLFAAAFKVYSTASARRFMSDLRDAQSKGFISQAPHYNSLFRCLESESVTPIIRDLIIRAATPLRAIETDFAIDSTDAPLISRTMQHFNVERVMGDKAYSSYADLELSVSKGAEPFIPFKSYAKANSPSQTWNRLLAYFILHREEFLAAYHKRSNAEATFSAIKRVFGDSVRNRTHTAQVNEVLLKVLAHNIRCLIHTMAEMGISPSIGIREVA